MKMLEEVKFLFQLDTDGYLRCQVAKNVDSPMSLLLALASEPDRNIRVEVARNPKTPLGTLHMLANDNDVLVADAAKDNLIQLTISTGKGSR